jgi:hypothetical protein
MDAANSYALFSYILWAMIAEALPFLLLGSLIATIVRYYLKPEVIERITAVPIFGILLASLIGLIFPLCECAIVPVARSLRGKGLSPAAAYTFMIAVPLINPIVIFSTAYAFRGEAKVIAGRFILGWVAILIIGALLLLLLPSPSGEKKKHIHHKHTEDNHGASCGCASCSCETAAKEKQGIRGFISSVAGEFFFMGRYFLLGAVITSAARSFIPMESLMKIGRIPILSEIIMMVLAFLFSVCSEADAFIARGYLPWFSQKAILAFLILGPMLDLKNTLLLFRSFPRREVILLIIIIVGTVFVTAAIA